MSRGISVSIGERLKLARKATGMSQTAFGSRCGVSLNGQSNFERNINVPGGDYLLQAAALGVDVCYVLTGLAGARDVVESELVQRFRAASQDVQGAVLRALGIPTTGQGTAVAISGDGHGQVVAGNVSQRGVTFNVAGKKKGAGK